MFHKPLTSVGYYKRGDKYFINGQYQEAIRDYDKAILFHPIGPDPVCFMIYNNRATAYCNLGNFEKAIDDYSKAIKLSPNNAKLYLNRSIAYCSNGQLLQATTDIHLSMCIMQYNEERKRMNHSKNTNNFLDSNPKNYPAPDYQDNHYSNEYRK